MFALLCFVLAVLASPFKSKSWLEAENVALRHQLIVLRRKVRGRARLTNNDRWLVLYPAVSAAVDPWGLPASPIDLADLVQLHFPPDPNEGNLRALIKRALKPLTWLQWGSIKPSGRFRRGDQTRPSPCNHPTSPD